MKRIRELDLLEVIMGITFTLAAIALIELIIALPLIIKSDLKKRKYDVNNDGKVNAQDYVAVMNYIMEEN